MPKVYRVFQTRMASHQRKAPRRGRRNRRGAGAHVLGETASARVNYFVIALSRWQSTDMGRLTQLSRLDRSGSQHGAERNSGLFQKPLGLVLRRPEGAFTKVPVTLFVGFLWASRCAYSAPKNTKIPRRSQRAATFVRCKSARRWQNQDEVGAFETDPQSCAEPFGLFAALRPAPTRR